MVPMTSDDYEMERRSNFELRKSIDDKLKELNTRRDESLHFKLAAMEKLLDKTIETKTEALTIAVSRIQGEGSACFARCNKQIAEFYRLIKEQEINLLKVEERQKSFIRGYAKEEVSKDKTHEHFEDMVEGVKTRVSNLELYNKVNWKQIVIWGFAAAVATYQALQWLHDILFKGKI